MGQRGITPEERFWKRVNKIDGGCWIWTGRILESGYGYFYVKNPRFAIVPHKFSWRLANGEIPEGKYVRHACGNLVCVNPEHLYLGSPASGQKPKPLEERFWSRVSKSEEGCWNWTGYKGSHGYAHIRLPDQTIIGVHRLSWILHNGIIPDNLWVLHTCDNRICVNPTHLFLGTPKDNVDDMIAKGRHMPCIMASRERCGEKNHKSKLNDEAVIEIRNLRSQGLVYREIAERFDVSLETITAVLNGKTWRHVKSPGD